MNSAKNIGCWMICSFVFTTAFNAQADTVYYTLDDVILADYTQMTGTFSWTFDLNDFEGGVGQFSSLVIPWTSHDQDDLNATIDATQSIEITLEGSVHDDGVDITLVLAQPLTPTTSSLIVLGEGESKYEIGGNGFHDGLFRSGSISPTISVPEPYTLTWDNEGGIGDRDWATAANWDPDRTPDANADTILANGDLVFLHAPAQEARTVAVDHGTLNVVFGGQLTVAENVNVAAGGVLHVDGTLTAAGLDVEGSLVNGGTITADTATLHAGSTLQANVGNGPHRLDVTGELNLDATNDTLALEWTPDGSASKFGGDYVVATYGSRIAEFDSIGGGGNPYSIGEAYLAGVDYGNGTDDQVTVSLHSLLDGDADLDGDVDFGDYLVLEAAFGGEGEWKDADFDFSGTVDFGDYLILEAAFGNAVPAAAAAVPEPGTLVMLLAGVTGLLAYARRKRQGSCEI